MTVRTLNILIGSKNDLEKLGGMQYMEELLANLKEQLPEFKASVSILSCHRNNQQWNQYIAENSASVWIACAGLAAHLAGMTDATIYGLGRLEHVLAVGISNEDMQKHQAALLSVTQLPGNPVRWMGYDKEGLVNALSFVPQLLKQAAQERPERKAELDFIIV